MNADDQQPLANRAVVERTGDDRPVAEQVGNDELTLTFFQQYMEAFRENIREDTIQLIKSLVKKDCLN